MPWLGHPTMATVPRVSLSPGTPRGASSLPRPLPGRPRFDKPAFSWNRLDRFREAHRAPAHQDWLMLLEYAPPDARPARRGDRNVAASFRSSLMRSRTISRPRRLSAEESFALQPFGDWKGVATNTQSRPHRIAFADADGCDLRGEISVADEYDAKLILLVITDGTPLPKDFLIKPENRLIAKNEDGSIAVDEPLCGVCTGIRDDKVSIVLPLSTGALFRAAKSVEMTVNFGVDAQKFCGFTLNCEDLRKALDWAVEKKAALAKSLEDDKCVPPPKAASCHHSLLDVLGLPGRLLRASHAPPLSRRDARRHARRQRRHRRVLSYCAFDPRPASSSKTAPPASSRSMRASSCRARRRGAAWAQRARLSSLCSDDGRAGARLPAGDAAPRSHHRVISPSRSSRTVACGQHVKR